MQHKFYLHKIRVNQAGYDASGRYWGINYGRIGNVYEYATNTLPDYVNHIRVQYRDQAKTWIRSCYPGATFYR